MTVQIVIFLIFLVFSFIFSSSEMAFISADKFYILVRSKNNKYYQSIHKLITTPKIYLYTVLVGNNLSNVIMTLTAESFLVKHESIAISFLFSFFMSLFILTFGEILPKTIASYYPEKFSFAYTPLINALYVILFPIIFVASIFSEGILLIAKSDKKKHSQTNLSKDDIEHLILSNMDIGDASFNESKMLKGIFDFSDKNASDIMIPRTEMFTVPIFYNFAQVKELLLEDEKIYTRIPVYEVSEDNVVGILNINDFIDNKESSIRQIMRTPTFVPETLTLDAILIKMKTEKEHFAVVVDEYGGIAGIVTYENIIEELIGDISDEFDEEEQIEKVGAKLVMDGDTRIDDLNEEYKLKLPEHNEFETVAGLVMFRLGRVAYEGDIVYISNSCKITVSQVIERSIKKVEIERIDENE